MPIKSTGHTLACPTTIFNDAVDCGTLVILPWNVADVLFVSLFDVYKTIENHHSVQTSKERWPKIRGTAVLSVKRRKLSASRTRQDGTLRFWRPLQKPMACQSHLRPLLNFEHILYNIGVICCRQSGRLAGHPCIIFACHVTDARSLIFLTETQ